MPKADRATLLALCRSLPSVTEDIKWGNDLVFSVGMKMFAGFTADGKDASFGCKVAEDDFGVLTAMQGIAPAKYAARFHWVDVDDGALPVAEALNLLRGSYDLVKAGLSQKLQRQIDEALLATTTKLTKPTAKKKKKASTAAKKKAKKKVTAK